MPYRKVFHNAVTGAKAGGVLGGMGGAVLHFGSEDTSEGATDTIVLLAGTGSVIGAILGALGTLIASRCNRS